MAAKKTAMQHEVRVELESCVLNGFLNVPESAKGIVLFAHGSGSSFLSPRNQLVSRFLTDNNVATLLFDLLTDEEGKLDATTRQFRFNIPFLAERLLATTEWVWNLPETKHLTVGYFGASTGSAAALIAAAELGEKVRAVVSRGGRPDLAGMALSRLQSPTLLIVGGDDYGVIELNEHSLDLIRCTKKLEIIPGATHLFEEPGTLEQVSHKAALWFSEYL